MTAVPPAAIEAAAQGVAAAFGAGCVTRNASVIRYALEAAAPLIAAAAAAAERERIRQLAIDHDAAITKDCECGPHPGRGRFADLIEGDSP